MANPDPDPDPDTGSGEGAAGAVTHHIKGPQETVKEFPN
jgi:hypothetical protein